MFSAAVVLLFFLMLLAPCLFAVIGSRRRDEEGPEVLANLSAAEPLAAPAPSALAGAEDEERLQPLAHPLPELARAKALRTLLEQAERSGRDAARTQAAERALDLDDLRRSVAAAEAEALTAQLLAAQARAAALAAASRAAAARAFAATEMAEMARQEAAEAANAAAQNRVAYARQRTEAEAAAVDRVSEKVPDHPAMHYPRARVNRRAA